MPTDQDESAATAAEATYRLLCALHDRTDQGPASATILRRATAHAGLLPPLGRETVRRRLHCLEAAGVVAGSPRGWQLRPGRPTGPGGAHITAAVRQVHDRTGLAVFAHDQVAQRGVRICLAAQCSRPFLQLIADHCPPQDGSAPLGDGRVLPGTDLLADTTLTPYDAPGAVLLASPQPSSQSGFFAHAPASAPAWRVLAVPLRIIPGTGPAGALSVAGPRDDLDARQEELLTEMHEAASPAAHAPLVRAA